MKYPLLFLVILALILSSGCIEKIPQPGSHMSKELVGNEVINETVVYGMGGYTFIPMPNTSGMYLINAETRLKGGDVIMSVGYDVDEGTTSRFGHVKNLVFKAERLGITNDYSTIDRYFIIPDKAENVRIAVMIRNEPAITDLTVVKVK
jgi:hypothetical protein